MDTNTQPEIRAVIFDMGRVLVDIDSKLLVEKLFKDLWILFQEVNPLVEGGRKKLSLTYEKYEKLQKKRGKSIKKRKKKN